ncbi:hypothetical protein Tco_0638565, partial [Tanacetum coccineum]
MWLMWPRQPPEKGGFTCFEFGWRWVQTLFSGDNGGGKFCGNNDKGSKVSSGIGSRVGDVTIKCGGGIVKGGGVSSRIGGGVRVVELVEGLARVADLAVGLLRVGSGKGKGIVKGAGFGGGISIGGCIKKGWGFS